MSREASSMGMPMVVAAASSPLATSAAARELPVVRASPVGASPGVPFRSRIEVKPPRLATRAPSLAAQAMAPLTRRRLARRCAAVRFPGGMKVSM